jgi:hypothetical protein
VSTIEDGLFNYFIGYTRANPEKSESIMNDSWAYYAQKELDRRRFKLIESLSEDELQAIAKGDIDLNKIIQRAADTHR